MPLGEAQIAGMATAVPPITATVDEVWDALGKTRGRRMPKLQGEEGARTRYFVEPLTSLMERRTQSQQTDAYLEHARTLARRVCRTALERSSVAPSDIGLVIGVSCTGVVLPSLDAELIPLIGLRSDVARLPITELGCGGGVAGLARGLDYLRAYPDRSVLLFAVEVPSLTFHPDDHSVDNLVAALVFADGAGAVVLRGGDGLPGWTLEHAGTVLVPEGARHLGYELRDGGLRVILSRELPDVVEVHLRGAVETFLEEAGLRLTDLDAVAAHPGGPRIVDAIQRALHLDPESLVTSRSVFAGNGNASSAGIFFVLEEMQRSGTQGRVLAIALGPGLSIELALMRVE
jgi:alkylresorcinol/alkylpyrone synthase